MKKSKIYVALTAAVFCVSLFVLFPAPLKGEGEVNYCGMPRVTAPAYNATVSGMMNITAQNDNVTSPEVPWTIAPGTTVRLRYKIVPAGTLLGDASNTADPQVREWRFSEVTGVNAQTNTATFANGNYTLGVHLSYYCSSTSGDHTVNYWPTFVDWYKIPIRINNAAATATKNTQETQNQASNNNAQETKNKEQEAVQNLEQIITNMAEKQKIIEALKLAPINEDYIVNKPEVNKTTKKIKLTGKAKAKSKVYLYIFSDPVVTAVDTDSDGNWSYDLSTPLSVGKHDVYVATKDSAGKIDAKSALTSFAVDSDYANPVIAESAAAKNNLPAWVYYVVPAVSFVVLAISVFLFVAAKRQPKPKKN